jgi:hypothetical protein
LRTRDKEEARALLHAKNEALRQPVLNRQIARVYLTASDPQIAKRTWQNVMDKMSMINHRFGEVVYSYTRSQAVADGIQVEVTRTAQEAGIHFPVFLTRSVYDAYVTVPPDVAGQDEAGRLWDVVWMLRFAIRKAHTGQARLPFALYVRNDNHRPRVIKLIAMFGPLDIDDPAPAITVLLPDED